MTFFKTMYQDLYQHLYQHPYRIARLSVVAFGFALFSALYTT